MTEPATRAAEHHPAQHGTVAAIRAHHEQLARALDDHTVAVLDAVDRLSSALEARRDALVSFCEEELLPHAAAEEATLYQAGGQVGHLALLVGAMTDEHRAIREQVAALRSARTPSAIAAAAAALRALFDVHLAKENDLLLPALVEAGVDVAELLAGMREVLGAHASPEPTPRPDTELDVRSLPPALRHERIFATFEALHPGEGFVLINDHDPKPLYYQFAAEHPGAFRWDYQESGPQVWRVRISRT